MYRIIANGNWITTRDTYAAAEQAAAKLAIAYPDVVILILTK